MNYTKNGMFYTYKQNYIFQFAVERTRFQAICQKQFRFVLILSPQFSRPFTIRWKNLRYCVYLFIFFYWYIGLPLITRERQM